MLDVSESDKKNLTLILNLSAFQNKSFFISQLCPFKSIKNVFWACYDIAGPHGLMAL